MIGLCLTFDNYTLLARTVVRAVTVLVALTGLGIMWKLRRNQLGSKRRNIVPPSYVWFTSFWFTLLAGMATYLLARSCGYAFPTYLNVVYGAAYIWPSFGLMAIVDKGLSHNNNVAKAVSKLPDEVIAESPLSSRSSPSCAGP